TSGCDHRAAARPTTDRSWARRAPDQLERLQNRRFDSAARDRRPSRKCLSDARRHRKTQAVRPSNGSSPETGKENHKTTLTAAVFGGVQFYVRFGISAEKP